MRKALIAVPILIAACNFSVLGDPDLPHLDDNSVDYAAIGNTKLLLRVAWSSSFVDSYVIDGARGTLRKITVAGHLPALSPDGSLIAFMSYGSSDSPSAPDILVTRPDGFGRVQLTALPRETEGAPAWSADGASVLFPAAPSLLSPSDIEPGIYRVSRLGGPIEAVVLLRGNGRMFGSDATQPHCFALSASISGDLAARCRPDYFGSGALYLINPNGQVRKLYDSPSSYGLGLGSPTFSPDGTRIAFVEANFVSGAATATVIDLLGTKLLSASLPVALVSNGHACSYDWCSGVSSICWMADGRGLLVPAMDGDRRWNLYAISATGSTMQRVTTMEERLSVSHVSCSP